MSYFCVEPCISYNYQFYPTPYYVGTMGRWVRFRGALYCVGGDTYRQQDVRQEHDLEDAEWVELLYDTPEVGPPCLLRCVLLFGPVFRPPDLRQEEDPRHETHTHHAALEPEDGGPRGERHQDSRYARS